MARRTVAELVGELLFALVGAFFLVLGAVFASGPMRFVVAPYLFLGYVVVGIPAVSYLVYAKRMDARRVLKTGVVFCGVLYLVAAGLLGSFAVLEPASRLGTSRLVAEAGSSLVGLGVALYAVERIVGLESLRAGLGRTEG